jgi:hypothetical protein
MSPRQLDALSDLSHYTGIAARRTERVCDVWSGQMEEQRRFLAEWRGKHADRIRQIEEAV